MSTAGECQGRSSVLEQLCVQFPLITELLLQKQEEIRLRVTVVSWEKKVSYEEKKGTRLGKMVSFLEGLMFLYRQLHSPSPTLSVLMLRRPSSFIFR